MHFVATMHKKLVEDQDIPRVELCVEWLDLRQEFFRDSIMMRFALHAMPRQKTIRVGTRQNLHGAGLDRYRLKRGPSNQFQWFIGTRDEVLMKWHCVSTPLWLVDDTVFVHEDIFAENAGEDVENRCSACEVPEIRMSLKHVVKRSLISPMRKIVCRERVFEAAAGIVDYRCNEVTRTANAIFGMHVLEDREAVELKVKVPGFAHRALGVSPLAISYPTFAAKGAYVAP